jgi:hypothetical protein
MLTGEKDAGDSHQLRHMPERHRSAKTLTGKERGEELRPSRRECSGICAIKEAEDGSMSYEPYLQPYRVLLDLLGALSLIRIWRCYA